MVGYLKQSVRYTPDGQQLLDSAEDAVMMEWERPLMRAHAEVMIPDGTAPRTRDVLNIGFGMGIIDGCGAVRVQCGLQCGAVRQHGQPPLCLEWAGALGWVVMRWTVAVVERARGVRLLTRAY